MTRTSPGTRNGSAPGCGGDLRPRAHEGISRILWWVREHQDGKNHQFLGVETTNSSEDPRTGSFHTPPQEAGTGSVIRTVIAERNRSPGPAARERREQGRWWHVIGRERIHPLRR
jgi:hypothetical protein